LVVYEPLNVEVDMARVDAQRAEVPNLPKDNRSNEFHAPQRRQAEKLSLSYRHRGPKIPL
jgi:hypothetical protein